MATTHGFRNTTGSPIAIGSSTVVQPGSSWVFYDASGPYFYDVASVQYDLEANPVGLNYQLAVGSLVFVVDSSDVPADAFYEFWSSFYGTTVTTGTAPVQVATTSGASVSASKVVTLTGDVTGSGVDSFSTSVDRIHGGLIPSHAPGALVNDGTGNFTWVRQAQLSRRATVVVPFGVVGFTESVIVSDHTVTPESVISVSIRSEEFIVQNTSVHVTDVTPGVGYTVLATAPLGATGDLTVHVSIQEGS